MKSRLVRAILLLVLLAGAALMRFLGSETASEMMCRKLEDAVSESLEGATLSIGRCAILPWEARVEMDSIRLTLENEVKASASLGRLVVQVRRPDLILARRLRFGDVTLERLSVAVDLSAAKPDDGALPDGGGACPVELMDRFRVDQFRLSDAKASVRISPEKSLSLEGMEAFIHSTAHEHVLKAHTGEGEIRMEGASLPISGLKLSGSLDMSQESFSLVHGEVSAGDVSAVVRGTISDICGHTPDASLFVRTSLPLEAVDGFIPGGGIGAKGRVSVRARVTGDLASPSVEGDLTLRKVSVGEFQVGDAYLAASLEDLRLQILKLTVKVGQKQLLATGSIDLGAPGFPVKVKADLDHIGFGRLVDMLTLHGAWPDFLATGQVEAEGALVPFHLAGRAALDVQNFKVFDRAWNAAGRTPMLETAPVRTTLSLDVNDQRVRLSDVSLTMPHSRLSADVTLNFDTSKGLNLQTDVDVLDLGADLKHIVQIPWGGVMTGKARVKGPYDELTITGQMTGRRVTFQALDFGNVAMDVHFGGKAGSVLDFRDVQIQKGRSRFTAKGALDLRGKEPLAKGFATFDRVWLSDLVGMIGRTHWSFDFLRGKGEALMTGAASVKGALTRPESLVEADFSDFVYYGRELGNARFRFSTRDGEVISFDQFDTDGPVGRLKAKGKVLLSEGLEFTVEGPGLSLNELSKPQGRDLDVQGTVDLKARLAGGFDDVRLRGEAALHDASLMKIPLGEGLLDLGMDDGILWSRGTIGEAITAEMRMQTSGPMPFAADLRVSTQKLEKYLDTDIQGLTGRVKATVHAAGTVDDLDATRGTARFEHLSFRRERMRVLSDGEFVLEFTGKGGLNLPSITLTGSNDLNLTGSFSLGEDGRLKGAVGGNFDARLAEFFTDSVEQAGGAVRAEFVLTGTKAAPSIIGTLSLKDVHGDMADMPVSAQGLEGTISFNQDRIFVDRVRGLLNDGPMTLSGYLNLGGGDAPLSMDMNVSVEGAAMTMPSWLPSTISGDARFLGSMDDLTVSGQGSVTNVRYSRDVGIDPKSLLTKISQRVPHFLRQEEEREWLHFDMDVQLGDDIWLDNNLVKARLGGELKVVGSNLNMGVLGTVRTEELGKAFFRGNEFELRRAAVDFTDRNRIAGTLDVLGETELRDYRVFLRVMGTMDDPEVSLSSEPALEQADVIMLLTLGFTTRETEMASSSGVGIGLIGETLLNLSGIDKQVKRFIPKNALFRDFNIQLSTQYSEFSGTVEPMAQLESKLLTDDLRLRFTQPVLSNKGRQAHLEYKVNEHLSSQIQWNDESSDLSMGDIGLDLKLRWEFE